jgi:pilus assembly protein Flp/PilA
MAFLFKRFVADTSGANAIEYGLIAALISTVIVAVLVTIGTKLTCLIREGDDFGLADVV